MKNIRLILITLAMLITSLAFSAIPPKVFDAMKVGNSAELSKLLGIQEYAARLNLRICSSFPEPWYLQMIRLSAETDFRMKSSQGDPEDLVRSLFVTMAAEA